MATTIAELVAKVGADTRDFEGGLKKTNSLLGGIGSLAMKAGAMVAAYLGARTIGQGISALTDYSSMLEQSTIAWGTLLKSQEEGAQMMQRLQQFAKQTPFDFAGVQEGARRLLAMGFAAKDVLPMMRDLGNAASALGLGTEGLNRLILAIGQMRAKTKVTAEEMRQLTEAGVPAWDILSQAIGKSVSETMKLAQQGKISADVFIRAFQQYSRQNYGDMMARQAQTFQGATQNIRDSLLQLGSTAFQPLFQELSRGAQAFAQFLSSAKAEQLAKRIAGGIGSAIQAIKELPKRFSGLSETVGRLGQGLWYGIVGYAQEQLPKLQEIFSKTVAFIKAVWATFGDDIKGLFGNSLGTILSVAGTALDTLSNVLSMATAIINGDWDRAWQAFKRIVYNVWSAILDLTLGAAEQIVRLVRIIGKAFGADLTGVDQAIAQLQQFKEEAKRASAEFLGVEQQVKTASSRWADYVKAWQQTIAAVSGASREAAQGMDDFRAAEQATTITTQNLAVSLDTASQAAENLGSSLLDALLVSHPAMVAVSREILSLEAQIAGVNAAIAANQAQQERWREKIQNIQKNISQLQEELGSLQNRLRELSAPRLTGMGEMEMQIQALRDHLARMDLAKTLRIPLEEAVKRFPLLAQGAEEFIKTLPTGRRALERYLQGLEGQYELVYQQQQRMLQQAAEGAQPEMTYEQALAEIGATKGRIAEVTAELDVQQKALEWAERALGELESAANILSQALGGLQAALQAAQQRQDVLNNALQLAYTWFLNDRQAMLNMGGAAAEQVPIIDEKARQLLLAVSNFASGTSTESIETIQAMANEFKISSAIAVTEVLNNLGRIPHDIYTYHHIVTVYEGGAAGPAPVEPRQAGGPVYPGRAYLVGELGPELFVPQAAGRIVPNAGGNVYVTVNVQGSVVAERDLAETVRTQLLRIQARNGRTGL